MRLTRPKPSQPLHLLLGRVNTRLDHVGHKIFSRLSREVKSPSLKHLRTQTRQQPQTAHCKMCNIWTKSFTDVRMESFFCLFFWVFSIVGELSGVWGALSVSPPDPLCLVALYVQSGEVVCQLWCSGLPFVCLPLPPVPSVLLILAQNPPYLE